MDSPPPPTSSTDSTTTPLLITTTLSRRNSLRGGAARFLHRASSRRTMREPSMLVREAAAEQLETRQSEWAYSKPFVVLDVIWNLGFVIAGIVVLLMSRKEEPEMPLRVWIVGYGFQCVVHMFCVGFEYRRRRRGEGEGGFRSDFREELARVNGQNEESTSVSKHLESANTMFSFIWWIIGFYWVSAGGQSVNDASPKLYWLCIIFLAFDVVFVVFCVALACVIGIAVCCCLPCIIAILYAVAEQEGASKEEIDQLPKFKFRRVCEMEKLNEEIQGTFGGIMTECNTEPPIEHILSPEDAECCICLSSYDDGAELRELPCGHHFHCACIDKWLHLNATCPLCKYNIIKSNNNRGREEV